MQNVTDRISNPFGMGLPGDGPTVPGYGDANADFHVVGDHPGVHGGAGTGVPFTESAAGRQIQGVLHEVGLLPEPYSDRPRAERIFFSYLHPGVHQGTPAEADYDRYEPSFDAELRAITAHVLLPVGERATRRVLRTYTSYGGPIDLADLHARELGAGGWLVLPIADVEDWTGDHRERLVAALEQLLATDYRRESDLGRFLPGGEPYYVR